MNRPRRRAAATLTEVVFSSLLVSLMLVASLKAVGAVYRTRLLAGEFLMAESLAQALLAEASSLSYQDTVAPTFGPESGESTTTRAAWDDVDDYKAWTATPPQTKDGTAVNGATGWTQQVIVERVEPTNPTQTAATETGLKRITVTITTPSGKQHVLTALRAAGGADELRPPLNTSYVTSVVVEGQLGAATPAALIEAAVTNHATP